MEPIYDRLSASACPDDGPSVHICAIPIRMVVSLVDMAPSSVLMAAAGTTCHPGRAGVVHGGMGEQDAAICAV